MKIRKRIKSMISLTLAVCLLLSGMVHPMAAQEDRPLGYVTMSVDANTLGAGFLYEPVQVPFYEGENYGMLTDRFLGGASNYDCSGTPQSSFYLAAVKLAEPLDIQVPQFILDELGVDNEALKNQALNKPGYLGQFDYSYMSGWIYSVDNEFPNVGTSDKIPQDGEVCRWQFTLSGYGADLGQDNSEWGAAPSYIGADRSQLLRKIAQINSSSGKEELLNKDNVRLAWENAYSVLEDLTVQQSSMDQALLELEKACNADRPASSVDIQSQLNQSLAYLLSKTPSPSLGSMGGEWAVIALARGNYGVPESYYSNYYTGITEHLQEVNGVLSTSKYTEYSRLILALSAIGKNPADVGGYHLLERLADYDKTVSQGINGAIFALLALDSNDYEIPQVQVPVQASRQQYIDNILNREVKKDTDEAGGFALFGSAADPDITAMALQALAPYRSQPKVSAAVDRAVAALSDLQQPEGGYTAFGSTSSESISQVIVALTALGIDPATDSRFVKSGGNLVSALLRFYVEGGGFKHVLTGNVDAMASEQGTYALVAYDRYVKGKNSLYHMTDAFQGGGESPDEKGRVTIEAPDQVSGEGETSFHAAVKIDGFPVGDYKLLDGILTIPDELSVEDFQPSDRIEGGSLVWNYNSEDKKLRFAYFNTDLTTLNLAGGDDLIRLFTLKLRVKPGITSNRATISMGGMTLKESSDLPAFIFQISDAVKTVSFVDTPISVRELYVGDDIDLIPSGKKAVAITIGQMGEGASVAYNGKELFFSPEMTEKNGLNTYVCMVEDTETHSQLQKVENYEFLDGMADEIKFGDVDSNGIINAQDALDVTSAWLRKTAAPSEEEILRMNVTADSRINTFDTLAIIEHYISGREFKIINQ